MPTQVITSKFYNQFNNGEDYSLNPLDFSGNLVGNVTDKLKTVQLIRVSWTSESDSLNTFEVNGNTLTRVAGSFISDNFIIGDVVELWDGITDVFGGERTILTISATSITFDGGSVPQATLSDATLYGKTELTAFRFKYGLIENAEPTNYVSKIDGVAENSFSAVGVGEDTGGGRITTFIDANADGNVESWKEENESVKVRYVQTLTRSDDYAQEFEIEHIFTILPYYQDGELSNLQTNVSPSLFSSTNCLKYVYNAQFTDALSNPNGIKSVVLDSVNGFTGWFNENFEGIATKYVAIGLAYTNQDTLLPETTINAQQKTRVNFNLRVVGGGSFSLSNDVKVGISILPNASDYQQNGQTINENFLLDTAFTRVDTAPIDSSIITNYTADYQSSAEIEVQFDVDYLAIDETRLNGEYYVIWVTTADPNIDGKGSDRTTLIVDVAEYDVDDTQPGFDNIEGWIEDSFSLKIPLQINVDLGAELNTLSVHLAAYNPSTDNIFNLQTYNYSLTNGTPLGLIFVGIAIAYNNISTRGFELPSSSQYNKANITSGGFTLRSGSINVFNYLLELGMKVNFEEWLVQPDADTVFYDVNEPNDGLNKKTSRYSLKEGYEIVTIVEANVQDSNNIVTNYKYISQPHS
jgi:hypothetical protein